MSLTGRLAGHTAVRSGNPLPFNDWLQYFNYQGLQYAFAPHTTLGEKQESPDPSFDGYVSSLYKSNSVVFACMLARMLLFSEARFQFRKLRTGRPGELWGNTNLDLLERPWPGGTTRDLLARAIQDADVAGNFYCARRGNQIRRMRPDWTILVLGSQSDDPATAALDAEVVGYIYQPGGPHSQVEPLMLLPEEVCHWAPIPDPQARYLGMSWLTPIIREVMADSAMTSHRLKFFENGATPNMVVSVDPQWTQQQLDKYIAGFKARHQGIENAYETLFLGAGMTSQVVGANLEQIDFKIVQGGGETRIAAAAKVPPIIVGLSEGLEAATYANYGSARRHFADGTMRPLWGGISGALANIVRVPGGSTLWYDDAGISFLQEDQKDAAEIMFIQAQTMESLIRGGYDPNAAAAAVVAGDFGRLAHTGLVSVQLLPPGTQQNGQNGGSNGQKALPSGSPPP